MDFWHLYVTDTKPEEISKLDKKFINGVHYCDSLEKKSNEPITEDLRDVYTGLGVVPLKAYMDAVHETGYNDWISGECFSRKHRELNSYEAAYMMKKKMEYLLY